jgi:hypothetical protein
MQPTRRPRPPFLLADSIPAPKAPATAAKPTDLYVGSAPDEPKAPPVEGDKLPPNNFGFEFVYVRAHLTLDDQSLTDIALRFKGNASYENFQRTPRRPYKIDFDRFVPRRKFKGLSSLNLSNNAFDPSQLREALSYEVYRKAGVPAPRTALAVLYLTVPGLYDHHFVGAYTLIEDVDDKPFLKSNFDSTDGLLLKPEGIRGLPYMGAAIAIYDQRYHFKSNHPNERAARQFIDFVKLLNYADDPTFRRDLPRYLDVDNLLRYLAVTVLITNLDSPLVTQHNFYLHTSAADGLTRILPWDMNLSFAGYGGAGGGRANLTRLVITHPWAGEQKLFDRILSIPEYDRAYRAHLRTFVQDFYNVPAMSALIDRMKLALAHADKSPGAPSPVSDELAPAGFTGTRDTLKDFVARRVDSVLDQLDGKPVPTFTPRPAPRVAAFAHGVQAPDEFGSLHRTAQLIRQHADTDGDFKLSLPELLTATDALFTHLSTSPDAAPSTPGSELKATTRMSSPDSAPLSPEPTLDRPALTRALAPLLRDVTPAASRANLLDVFRAAPASPAASAWATTLLRSADTDQDNHLSRAELTVLVTKAFCLADQDHDDHLDERELIEALDLLATVQK